MNMFEMNEKKNRISQQRNTGEDDKMEILAPMK